MNTSYDELVDLTRAAYKIPVLPARAPWSEELTPNATDADLRRVLLRFRYDPIFKKPKARVPIKLLADYCGLSRQTCYAFMSKQMERLRPESRARLEAALRLVLSGELYWARVDRHHWKMFLCR